MHRRRRGRNGPWGDRRRPGGGDRASGSGRAHREDGDFALAWVRPYGHGRVFYTAFGHRAELYENPQMLQFHLDGKPPDFELRLPYRFGETGEEKLTQGAEISAAA